MDVDAAYNASNEELPIAKLSDDMFQELFQKYLTAGDLLKVGATCKSLKKKCEKAEEFITLPVDLVISQECLVSTLKIDLQKTGYFSFKQKHNSSEFLNLNSLLRTQFKLEFTLFRGDYEILKNLANFLGYRKVKIRNLCLRSTRSSAANFREMVEKFAAQDILFYCGIPEEYYDDPVISKNISLVRGTMNPEILMKIKVSDFVLVKKFTEAEAVTMDMIRQLIKELAYGERRLKYWQLEQKYSSAMFDAVFAGMNIYHFCRNTDYARALSETTERPMVVRCFKGDSQNVYCNVYAVACTDGAFYKILTVKLIIEKITLAEWVKLFGDWNPRMGDSDVEDDGHGEDEDEDERESEDD